MIMLSSEDVSLDPFLILSHYATAQIVYAADMVGIWESLVTDGAKDLDIEAFAGSRNLSRGPLRAIVDYLVRAGFLDFADASHNVIRLAPKGRMFLATDCLGHFALLVGSYGEVLQSAGNLARGLLTYGIDIRRNPEALASASTRIGKSKIHSSYNAMLDRVGQTALECVVDIGCGGGDFLAALADWTEAKSAVGVDVLPEACAIAEKTMSKTDCSFEIVCGDIANLGEVLAAYAGGVDLVTALFVLHELIGRSPGIEDTLLGIKTLLRPGGRLLLLEKATDVLTSVRHPPYFSEFKLVHDLTNQTLCERRAWRNLLDGAGLEVLYEDALAPHTGSVLIECGLRT